MTVAHPLQVLDGPLLETVHDFRVDVIVTPDAVIDCAPARRPRGLYLEHLSLETIAAILVLAAHAPGIHLTVREQE